MKNILVMCGLASLIAVGALQGCSDDSDDSGSAGSAGAAAGSAGAAGAAAGSGGAAAGAAGEAGAAGAAAGAAGAGGGGDTLYCGKTKEELPPISKCDDPNASDCTKAFCADSGTETDCKTLWETCESDPACNKAIACFSQCSGTGNPDDADGAVGTCSPIAVEGGALSKALALQKCNNGIKACGGDGSIGGN